MIYHKVIKLALFVALLLLPAPAWAHYHLGWIINEVYTNADGTNQFIELFNPSDNGQDVFNTNPNTGPASLFSDDTSNEFVFPSNLPSSLTSGKYLLIGTSGFASLAGAPAVDFTLPGSFFDITGDTIRFGDGFVTPPPGSGFGTVDLITFGSLPTNGTNSISADGTTIITNSPTNFAGMTGSVVAEPKPFGLALLALMGLFLFVWRRNARRR